MSTDAQALSRDGFVKLGAVLDGADIRRLQATCAVLLDTPALPYSDYQTHKHSSSYEMRFYRDEDWTVGIDLVGASAEFDALMAKLLTHPRVVATMEGVLGKGYKLWQLNIRRHEPGSQGQPLHQDAPGGLGISVLVDDTPELDGATVFLPRSHRWPIDYSDVGVTLQPRRLKSLLAGATGAPGDVSFFFNRTWHGRFPGDRPRTAILMTFHAVGSKYPIHDTPREVLAGLDPELRRLLDPTTGVRRLEGNEVLVTAEDGVTEPPRTPELRYALHGVAEAPRTPAWRVVRSIGHARRLVVNTVGRERLHRWSSALGFRPPG